MKKSIFFIATVAALVITMAFSSCTKKEEHQIVLTVESDAKFLIDIDDATKAQIEASIKAIDTRLVQMFGKSFTVEADDDFKVSESYFNRMGDRIRGDQQIKAEFVKLSKLRSRTGLRAVEIVYFVYRCGEATIYKDPTYME